MTEADPMSPLHSDGRSEMDRPVSPVPSCVSMKSDSSMFEPAHFNSGQPHTKPTSSEMDRPVSPVPSCVSMKSDSSMFEPAHFSTGQPHTKLNYRSEMDRPVSPVPSCVSMKSDSSMFEPAHFNSGQPHTKLNYRSEMDRPVSPVPSCVSMKSDKSMFEPAHFNSGQLYTKPLSEIDRSLPPVSSCVSMKSDSSMFEPAHFSPGQLHMKPQSEIDRSESSVPSSVSVKSDSSMFEPAHFSTETPHTKKTASSSAPAMADLSLCEPLNTKQHVKQIDYEVLRSVKENHKASLKSKSENISEDIIKPGAEIPLNKVYTELYITEGESEGVNKEHEVWQVESASRAQTIEDTPINCNDIFKPLPGQEKQIRTVMTTGIAGIGKTVSVQKFILDWIDGVANQDVDFIFPLSFRELNLVRGHQYSFHKLLLDFYPELKDGEAYKDCKVVFIFDGLDESRISLKFHSNMLVSDVKQTSSVDILIMSLIQGTLFPSSFIWITSRPAPASQIPAQYISRVTEIRGFNDHQKEVYFRKRISDENQANRIISHIKASRSLHIMCYIPVFCWIAATVLQEILEKDDNQEIPKTLTGMFTHFLVIQMTRSQKYKDENYTDSKKILKPQKEIILGLAKLAFRNLQNGNLMFYEEDLKKCDIDISEATVYSGLCTKIFKEESLLNQKKVYYFVHLTVQEFLAALHVFVSYSVDMENIGDFFSLEESLKLAATKVLQSKNGHLDVFLRFLMGISLESNQKLLLGLLNKIHNTSKSIEETCQLIKNINRGLSPEQSINLLHCLFEMNDHSMHKEVQKFLSSPMDNKLKLSPAHCSALAHMLLMSEEVLDEFDLKIYNTSDEGRRRLIPAVRCCRKAKLDGCKLNMTSFETVKRCLQSANSLTHLDLSCNTVKDTGVQILSAGLISSHCKLQSLGLTDSKLSLKSCEIVASVLQSPNSLVELDLSHNDLGDSGVQLLSKGLGSSDCKLQILRLTACCISEEGCGFLASALTSNPSHLKALDLSYNHPGDLGMKQLSARLEDPHCKLETLNMDYCAKNRLKSGVQKYACELTLDHSTAHKDLFLSDNNRKVILERKNLSHSHHLAFSSQYQVLCREALSGRCYWEAEWSGVGAHIAMACKNREGCDVKLCCDTPVSWSLFCSADCYSAQQNNKHISIPAPSSGSRRVGVYLNWPASTLSFYSVSSDTLTHLHTFHSTFSEPLYPVFCLEPDSSVWLC